MTDVIIFMIMEVLIGTSGYDYPEWKGIFYPQDLKRKDFLSYYATRFNALEVNNTFYNMPTADRLLSFWKRSEGKLQFSIKANRMLTHEVGAGWQQNAAQFIQAVVPLAEKGSLCAVLFQFPQSFHYTPENRVYLAKLIESFGNLPVVIEFRHVEWIRESVLEGLQLRGASLCYCDMPNLKYLPNNATSVVPEPVEGASTPTGAKSFYLRLHGRNADAWYASAPKAQTSIISTNANGANTPYATDNSPNGSSRYNYDYTDQELSEFVPVIQNVILTGRQPIVFFHNPPNGSGAKNAVKFKDLLK